MPAMASASADVPIRDAATLIVFRGGRSSDAGPEILMGQRGARAAFMPDKVVFPGGAVAPGDDAVALAGAPSESCLTRLTTDAGPTPQTLLAAAIRELWEETGLILGRPGAWSDPPGDWAGFAAAGFRPDATGLRFVFRAITPPGRPRRFDARFFLVSADRLSGDHGSGLLSGDGELSNLQWIALDRVRGFNLPFITQVVLAELPVLLADDTPPRAVPFFDGQSEEILMQTLAGRSPLDVS